MAQLMAPYTRGGFGNAAAASATVSIVMSRYGSAAWSGKDKQASKAIRERVFMGWSKGADLV
jgi:hypothetical protein